MKTISTSLLLSCCVLAVIAIPSCNRQSPEPLGQITIPDLHLEPIEQIKPLTRDANHTSLKPASETSWDASNPKPWKYIILHHSAASCENAADLGHTRQAKELGKSEESGYHFIITNGDENSCNGEIVVNSRWQKQKRGSHTSSTADNEHNTLGIGICLVGDFSTQLPSRAQMDSLKKLLDFLIWKHKIKIENILVHCDAPQAKTQCPGNKLRDYLKKILRKRRTGMSEK